MEYNNLEELDDITIAEGTIWKIKNKEYNKHKGTMKKLTDSDRNYVNDVLSKFKDDYFKLELCYLKEYNYDIIITRKIDTAEWNDKEFNTLEFEDELENYLHINKISYE